MTRPTQALASPWYAGGLRFECQPDCGACCTNHDDYAYVYLADDDAPRLAAHFGIELAEFLARHTEDDDGHLVLKMNGPDCLFLDGARCTVYEARPVQCRTFPFWKENLTDRRAWRALRGFCPGIDRGEVHGLLQIEDQVARRSAESRDGSLER